MSGSPHRRRRRWPWLLIAGLVVSALIAARCLVVVDETEFAVVTSFGKPVATFGDQAGESGPHFRWPWQVKWAVDRRLQTLDTAPRELITGDRQNLEVSAFIVWRVADPLRFLKASGTLEAARARLGERVSATLGQALGHRDLAALASSDPAVWSLDAVVEECRDSVAPLAASELGIEVLELGLRRFVFPLEVRPAVFELIRSERRQVAATLRAEGEARFREIVSEAERRAEETLAKAEARALELTGRAEAERARALNEAQARDPAFARFLEELKAYESVLDEKATVVLSTTSPLLRLFSEGPGRFERRVESPAARGEQAGDRP